MAVLHYLKSSKVFAWEGTFEDRVLAKAAGFQWNPGKKQWWTDSSVKAATLAGYANEDAALVLNESGVLETVKSSRALDGDIEIPTKPDNVYRGYQKAGVKFLIESDRRAQMIGDEMGVGKTIQVCGFLNACPGSCTLVIVPASLKLNWEKELNKWLVEEQRIQVIKSGKDDIDGQADIIIVNYDLVRSGRLFEQLMREEFDLLVIDEIHRLKNPDTQQTKSILGYWEKDRKHVIKGLESTAKKVVALTGTPIPNKPIEIFPLLQRLAPDVAGRSKMTFGLKYCNAHRGSHGWVWDGSSNEDELQTLLRGSGFMIRRLKADVLPELPAKTRKPVTVTATGRALKEALKAEREAAGGMMPSWDEIRGGGVRVAFDQMAEVRVMIGEAKAPFVAEYAKELLAVEDKIIIMAHHKVVVQYLMGELKAYSPVAVTGSHSQVARQEAVDAFQNNPGTRVFIGNIQAAGVGLTLTAASQVVFAEMSWVPADNVQAEDRAHRIGQEDAVTIHYCVVEDSLDARILDVWMGKESTIARIVDNKTKVEDIEVGSKAKPLAAPAAKRGPVMFEDVEIDVEALQMALADLAYRCDGAHELDDQGFNAQDTDFGKSLAYAHKLSDRMAQTGYRMIRKYHRQIPADLKARLHLEK